MMRVRYSLEAEIDLDAIAEFTRQTWGEKQVHRYLDELEKACIHVGQYSLTGRRYERALRGRAADRAGKPHHLLLNG